MKRSVLKKTKGETCFQKAELVFKMLKLHRLAFFCKDLDGLRTKKSLLIAKAKTKSTSLVCNLLPSKTPSVVTIYEKC